MKAFLIADGKFNSSIQDELGMDLRDWFAGLAMQDFMTSRDTLEYEDIAQFSYELADAMMKQREKKHE
jgi:hypothetical protein